MIINANVKPTLKAGVSLFWGTVFIFFIDFIAYIFNSTIINNMDVLSWGFYTLAAFGQASLFALILFACFYIPFSFLNRKIATTIFTLFAIVVQTVIIVDIFVFDLYKFHINGFVLELVFGGAATDIFVFDWSMYMKFGVLVLLFCILPFCLNIIISNKAGLKITRKQIKVYSIVMIVSLVISNIGYAIAHVYGSLGIQKAATAMPLYFPLTANSLLKKLGIESHDPNDALHYGQVSTDIQYPINKIEVSDTVSNYNIIYIVIDSWNPSTFDSVVSPNMFSFSQKGQVLSPHLSSSNGTRGSLFGIFFGLSYSYGQEFQMSKVSPVFVDRLIDLNYDIKVFPSSNFSSPPFNKMIFRRVPDVTIKTNGRTPFERDNQITKDFLDYFEKKDSDKPFFSLIFYDLPHAISIPKEYQTQFQPSWETSDYMKLNNSIDRTPFFNLYKNCVYYTDKLVGKVLEEVEKKGILDKTIIVITGDHGQEFNENKKNYWGHNGNFSKWQTQVPFIIYYPGIEPGKTYNNTTTHYDIAPTILHRFLGVKNRFSDYSMGFDLWDTHTRYPHIVGDYINYGFVMDKMILTTGHTGYINVTDTEMNDLPYSAINAAELRRAVDKKNMFYKK